MASVKLLDVGVPVANLGDAVPARTHLRAWARYACGAGGAKIPGSELVKIESDRQL